MMKENSPPSTQKWVDSGAVHMFTDNCRRCRRLLCCAHNARANSTELNGRVFTVTAANWSSHRQSHDSSLNLKLAYTLKSDTLMADYMTRWKGWWWCCRKACSSGGRMICSDDISMHQLGGGDEDDDTTVVHCIHHSKHWLLLLQIV